MIVCVRPHPPEGATALIGPWPPHYLGFDITLN
jgi:hypothetical protein